MVQVHPTQYHRERWPPAEQARDDAGQNPNHRRWVEDRGEQQRAGERHQISAQTASRRSTYLLYSPKRVRKLGSDLTASVTMRYLSPRTLRNSKRARRMCQSLVMRRTDLK